MDPGNTGDDIEPMEGVDSRPIVIDGGSRMMKAGFVGDDEGVCSLLNGIGRTPIPAALREKLLGSDTEVIGDGGGAFSQAVLLRKGALKLDCPVERGVVTNWDDMQRVWEHVMYNELRVEPETHPVLLVEPPLNPKAQRERTAQIFFEVFKVPALLLASSAALSMHAFSSSSSSLTGLVLESGDGVTHAVPLYLGHPLPHAVRRLELAGNDLTAWMEKVSRRPRILPQRSVYPRLLSDSEGSSPCGCVHWCAAAHRECLFMPPQVRWQGLEGHAP